MSGEEKKAQIGEAVTAYQAAKTECAHIDQKIDRVYSTYRTVGETMNKTRGSIEETLIKDGKLAFGYVSDRIDASFLLNASELTALILERDEARKRKDEAYLVMRDLGITNLA